VVERAAIPSRRRQGGQDAQVVVVGPISVGVGDAGGVEAILIIVDGQRAVVLGQSVLDAGGGEERLVLRLVPLGDDVGRQVALDIGAQIEQLGPQAGKKSQQPEMTSAADPAWNMPGISPGTSSGSGV
jgi:hypothetical protein